MMDKRTKVHMVFDKVIPELTSPELDRLLAFGEGIAFKVHQEQAAPSVSPLQEAERPRASEGGQTHEDRLHTVFDG